MIGINKKETVAKGLKFLLSSTYKNGRSILISIELGNKSRPTIYSEFTPIHKLYTDFQLSIFHVVFLHSHKRCVFIYFRVCQH